MHKAQTKKFLIVAMLIVLVGISFLFVQGALAQNSFANPGATDAIDDALRATRAGAGVIARSGGTAGLLTASAGAIISQLANAGKWGLIAYGILLLVYYALWWFIGFGYSLLNAAVHTALDPHWFKIDAVTSAWALVRDFANIWFIIIFLFIAIGTILRLQNYQAKRILPILLIMAFLVNFSMPITGIVIDTSNVIAFQFLNAICPEIEGDTPLFQEKCNFSANLENALDTKGFTASLDTALEEFQEQDAPPAPGSESPGETGILLPGEKAHAFVFLGIPLTFWTVVNAGVALSAAWSLVSPLWTHASPLGGVLVGPFVSLLVSDIFLLVTAFVILALGILFLIRIASLLFIAILSPLGFAAMILPSTQGFAKKWWDFLLKQSFFAPFALFFLWFSLKLLETGKLAFTQAGVSYDFTDPTNARVIFYVFALILLYGSLWIARTMGAIGASTVISWGNSLKNMATGAIGGVLLRRIVAPIGQAAKEAGVAERIAKIPYVGPLAGSTAQGMVDSLAGAGKKKQQAEAQAALGLRLPEREQATYFEKLDRAGKEAMLKKLNADQREALIASTDLSAAQKQDARNILGSFAFTGEEQLKSKAQEFAYGKNLMERWAEFGALPDDVQKQILLNITDAKKRAQFLYKVKEEATNASDLKGLSAYKNANAFLEKNTAFSRDQQFANTIARHETEITEAEKNNKLVSEFEKMDNQELRLRFATNDDQRLGLVEGNKENLETMKKLALWIRKLDPETRNKFHREKLGKLASVDAVVAYIDSLPSKTEEDFDYIKQIVSVSSPQQLANLVVHWEQTPNPVNNWLKDISKEVYQDSFNGRQQGDFEKRYIKLAGNDIETGTDNGGNKIEYIKDNWTTKGKPSNPPLSQEFSGTTASVPLPSPEASTRELNKYASSADVANIARDLRDLFAKGEQGRIDQIVQAIKSVRRTKDLDPITKVGFIDGISQNSPQFKEALVKEINSSDPKDLAKRVPADVMRNVNFQNALLRKATMSKLYPLIQKYGAELKGLKEKIMGQELIQNTTTVQNYQTTNKVSIEQAKQAVSQDPELHSQAIAEAFKQEYNNEALGKQIAELRKRQAVMSPVQRVFKEKIFGE